MNSRPTTQIKTGQSAILISDRIAAAGLNAAGVALGSSTCALTQDPDVLQPVVDSTFTAHVEDVLRRSLRATRAEVPDRLARWLASLPATEGRSHVQAPPTALQAKVFESRREGISFRPGWWCPQCAADRDTYRKAALTAEQERAALARERAEALAQAAEVHEREQQAYQAVQAARLAEQRPVFGAWLLKPFNTYALPIMTRAGAAHGLPVPPAALPGRRGSPAPLERADADRAPLLEVPAEVPAGDPVPGHAPVRQGRGRVFPGGGLRPGSGWPPRAADQPVPRVRGAAVDVHAARGTLRRVAR